MPEIKKQRPKFLDPLVIHLPLPGKLSIMHRISGTGMFLILPCLIYLLQLSLGTPQDFEVFRAITHHPLVKLFLLVLLYGFLHHFFMGIRILLIDMHKGVEIHAARKSAKVVLFASITLAVILGVTLW